MRTQAEKEAKRVLAEVFGSTVSLPVRVESVARHLHLEVRRRPLKKVSGFLYRDGSQRVVGVNSDHGETRQRFTIAHEVGHALLHQGRELILDGPIRVSFRNESSSLATDKEEIEANQFAAELLMPAAKVVEWINKNSVTRLDEAQLTRRLAKVFDVSEDAMAYRLMNLGIRSDAS